ncbi:MAG TPA: HNH endonuclease signature motif containing protein [Trebonia sp.]
MAISKRLRYEVLRRDGYACRYCGAKAPGVELAVDHVVPKALGGTDDPSNLVAACAACNSGKTSSSPDAPLIADVDDDAVRWARAMRSAADRALADLDARAAGRYQFAKWWDAWTFNDGGGTVPRPSDWGLTVDQLVAAGLPLAILEDCVDLAMGRKQVVGSEKFRYMCGVAWRKLAEIQQDAARCVAANDDDFASGVLQSEPVLCHAATGACWPASGMTRTSGRFPKMPG